MVKVPIRQERGRNSARTAAPGQATSPMAREMVAQGAQVLVTTWKSVIRELHHEDTGEMLKACAPTNLR